MTNPTRRSRLALPAGFVAGVVVIGGAVLASGAWLLVRGLPDDPMDVETYRSLAPSRLEAGDGRVIAEFPLVESVEPLQADPTLLVEAYLSLHTGAFYEARVDRVLPLLPVVIGALSGDRLGASPLSRSVAEALSAGTRPGPLRDLRTDLLAARLDSRSELHVRVAARLQTLPLCHGRRGIMEALRACLGVRDAKSIGPAEAAFLAAAAAFSMDLSGDLDLLASRAAAVLDRLVLQRRLDAEDAPAQIAAVVERARARVSATRAPGDDPLVVSLTERMRRRFGMSIEPAPLVIRTTLHAETQGGLAKLRALREGAWVVVDPRTGRATAVGGDLLTPLPDEVARRFATFLPISPTREPDIATLLGGVLGAAEALADSAPPALDTTLRAGRRLEAVTSLRHGTVSEEIPADAPVIGTLEADPEDAWSAIDAFSKEGRLRVAREGRVLVFVHPAAVGVLIAAEPAAITQLRLPANVLPAVTGTNDFAVPDGLWIAADGSVRRRGAGR